MTRETFDGAALRGEQEARDERRGESIAKLVAAARGALAALSQPGTFTSDVALAKQYLTEALEPFERKPKDPARYLCGCPVAFRSCAATDITPQFAAYLARQNCAECRKGVRT